MLPKLSSNSNNSETCELLTFMAVFLSSYKHQQTIDYNPRQKMGLKIHHVRKIGHSKATKDWYWHEWTKAFRSGYRDWRKNGTPAWNLTAKAPEKWKPGEKSKSSKVFSAPRCWGNAVEFSWEEEISTAKCWFWRLNFLNFWHQVQRGSRWTSNLKMGPKTGYKWGCDFYK